MNSIVSIIICTRNREESLRETLSSIAGMEVPGGVSVDLVVVDNGSKDQTKSVVEKAGGGVRKEQLEVRYFYEPRAGQCFARNKGLAEAKGEVIVFTDDDVRPMAKWLERLIGPILRDEADAVQGGYTHPPTHIRPWMLNSNAHGPMTDEWLKDAKIDNLIGLNMAFSRKVLEKVPSFDPELGPGQLGFADDSLFGMQIHAAGYRLLAVPEARIEHHYDLSRISREHLLKRARSAGRSNAYVDYHWHHKTVARPGYVLAKLKVKLMLMRLGGRGGVRMSEGLSQWESDVLQWKAYLEEMKVLVKKPRNYEKHGLRKLR